MAGIEQVNFGPVSGLRVDRLNPGYQSVINQLSISNSQQTPVGKEDILA